MSGTETIVPEIVEQVANDISAAVPPCLDSAKQYFTEGDVEGDAFSQGGIELAVIFPSCREFMLEQCEKKTEMVNNLVDKLRGTAAVWKLAEGDNTIDLPSC